MSESTDFSFEDLSVDMPLRLIQENTFDRTASADVRIVPSEIIDHRRAKDVSQSFSKAEPSSLAHNLVSVVEKSSVHSFLLRSDGTLVDETAKGDSSEDTQIDSSEPFSPENDLQSEMQGQEVLLTEKSHNKLKSLFGKMNISSRGTTTRAMSAPVVTPEMQMRCDFNRRRQRERNNGGSESRLEGEKLSKRDKGVRTKTTGAELQNKNRKLNEDANDRSSCVSSSNDSPSKCDLLEGTNDTNTATVRESGTASDKDMVKPASVTSGGPVNPTSASSQANSSSVPIPSRRQEENCEKKERHFIARKRENGRRLKPQKTPKKSKMILSQAESPGVSATWTNAEVSSHWNENEKEEIEIEAKYNPGQREVQKTAQIPEKKVAKDAWRTKERHPDADHFAATNVGPSLELRPPKHSASVSNRLASSSARPEGESSSPSVAFCEADVLTHWGEENAEEIELEAKTNASAEQKKVLGMTGQGKESELPQAVHEVDSLLQRQTTLGKTSAAVSENGDIELIAPCAEKSRPHVGHDSSPPKPDKPASQKLRRGSVKFPISASKRSTGTLSKCGSTGGQSNNSASQNPLDSPSRSSTGARSRQEGLAVRSITARYARGERINEASRDTDPSKSKNKRREKDINNTKRLSALIRQWDATARQTACATTALDSGTEVHEDQVQHDAAQIDPVPQIDPVAQMLLVNESDYSRSDSFSSFYSEQETVDASQLEDNHNACKFLDDLFLTDVSDDESHWQEKHPESTTSKVFCSSQVV